MKIFEKFPFSGKLSAFFGGLVRGLFGGAALRAEFRRGFPAGRARRRRFVRNCGRGPGGADAAGRNAGGNFKILDGGGHPCRSRRRWRGSGSWRSATSATR
nr:MAG TPA: hypothetical protein [Caudoviricetes sp.]